MRKDILSELKGFAVAATVLCTFGTIHWLIVRDDPNFVSGPTPLGGGNFLGANRDMLRHLDHLATGEKVAESR